MSEAPQAHDASSRHGERFHPLTPLVAGWKTIAIIVAVAGFNGIDGLIEMAREGAFTFERVSIGAAIAVGLVILSIGIGVYAWWRTWFTVNDEGVTVTHKILGTNSRVAPRERIDSVSVERPLVARLCGLAKVRIELAGGGESHIELEYLSRARAEDIHAHILDLVHEAREEELAAGEAGAPPSDGAPASEGTMGSEGTLHSAGTVGSEGTPVAGRTLGSQGAPPVTGEGPTIAAQVSAASPSHHAAPAGSQALSAPGAEELSPGARSRRTATGSLRALTGELRAIAYDGDGDGELLADIPTSRLLHSMLRDVGLWIAVLSSLIASIAWLVWQVSDGFSLSFGAIVAFIPVLIAAPKLVLGKLEAGWGFVSRATTSGMRARRGLLNSRSDNLSAFKIQNAHLIQPLLWRGPGWIEARVKTAGMDDDAESVADKVLPVGTMSELRATLGHLLPPLGEPLLAHPAMHPAPEGAAVLPGTASSTAQPAERGVSEISEAEFDHELMLALVNTPALELPGTRPTHWTSWIARKRDAVVLTENAVIHRYGILARHALVIPRDRIQSVNIDEGPLARRWSLLDLAIGYGADTHVIDGLPREDALALAHTLGEGAGLSRRYSERSGWAMPRLLSAHAAPASVSAERTSTND